MNRLQKYLVQAGNELDIKVIAPFQLVLPSKIKVYAEAFLPQLGAEKGMIVVHSYEEILDIVEELIEGGYAYSVLDEPLETENYNLESYKEMFFDWGWASKEEKPIWMI